MNTRRLASLAFQLGLGLVLAGCATLDIRQPTNNEILPANSLTVAADFRLNTNNSIRVRIDGTDVTPQFAIVYATAPGTIAGTITVAPGPHTLTIDGTFSNFLQQTTLSRTVNFTAGNAPVPALGFAPTSVTTTAGGMANVTVTISVPQAGPVSVTLAPSGSASSALSTTIAANQTASPNVAVTGGAVGNGTIGASAGGGITPASLSVTVEPGLTSISPTSGTASSPVTLTGSGFVAGATVRMRNQNATGVNVVSSTTITATVPAGLTAGAAATSVIIAGKTSAAVPFTVTAVPPPMPTATLFRASAQDVQSFTFTPAAGAAPAVLALVDTEAAAVNGGTSAIGVGVSATSVARSHTGGIQVFTAPTPPNFTLAVSRNAGASGTGSAAAIAGTTVVRALDVGIEVGVLGAGSFTTYVSAAGSVSATGVAVDILGTLVVRSHSSGIDVFSVATPATPTRLSAAGTGAGNASALGTGVKFLSPTRAVRTIPEGIEVYDLTAPASPTRIGIATTGFVDSAMQTSVAVEPGGTAVIRATAVGLERYTISAAGVPTLVASRNGRVSTTGTGAAVVAGVAFRATNDRVEAYDLPALGAVIADAPATVSAIGVGLAGR